MGEDTTSFFIFPILCCYDVNQNKGHIAILVAVIAPRVIFTHPLPGVLLASIHSRIPKSKFFVCLHGESAILV